MQPLISISGSEHELIKKKLADIAIIDNRQVYPDYKICSKQGFTVGIARATTNDLVSNKTDVPSHVAEELDHIDCDIRIFLLEDWMGRDRYGKISLPGGQHRNRDYIAVINQVMSACIACNALWVPSSSLNATCAMLRQWNDEYFQRPIHNSLKIRPRRAEKIFTLDLETGDQVWWLSDIPGLNLGIKRAEYMLRDAGSLLALFIKTRKELQEIYRIGPEIADGFARFLCQEITFPEEKKD